MDTRIDHVTFETSVHWVFAEERSDVSPSVNRYHSDFQPGETLLLPLSIAEARAAAGLGRIVAKEG
ncbi:MAG: hypothetical protein OEY86_07100 [Nitrospira sp.]|nr:hypothetical protein [Nitrospira sp.]